MICDNMKPEMRFPADFKSFPAKLLAIPQFVLFCIALYNLFDVPVRYGATCPYNYQDQFYYAFLLLVAASALLVGKWWSYLGAVLFCAYKIYFFVGVALLAFGVIRKSPEDSLTSEDWIAFMSNNPDEYLQIILAALIAVFAVIGLVQLFLRNRRPLA